MHQESSHVAVSMKTRNHFHADMQKVYTTMRVAHKMDACHSELSPVPILMIPNVWAFPHIK